MLKVLTWSLVAALSTVTVVAAAGPEPTTEEQKVLYALGIAVSQSLTTFNLSETELEMVKVGISDGVLHKTPKADLQVYGPQLQELQRTRMAAVAAEEKKAGQAFLA